MRALFPLRRWLGIKCLQAIGNLIISIYSVEDMRKLVSRSSKKSCELDPMPTNLVVGMSDTLLPIITSVVNFSLSLGHFPSDWKTALVDSRLKKSKQGTSLSNLRPVSNLQYLSKLVERAVYDQTTDHVTQSGLYPASSSQPIGWVTAQKLPY